MELMNSTEKYLDAYAGSGLRTLLLAEKEITTAELEAFRQEYKQAS
jgi:tRNA/tmRNA/rRNA uracil-C5-methylase (TrmA/RlmC/RlmD family)